MDEESEEIKQCEHRINGIIWKIRKDRNRACYQNILTFFNRNEPKVDMECLKEMICDMEKREIDH